MARSIKPEAAKALLADVFEQAEEDFRAGVEIALTADVAAAIERLFVSETQAYREALVGCAVARILDPEIDIRLPATDDGETAFSGRSLADHAITPFLRTRAIPISASPYLSALRGGARFVAGGEPRIQRDKPGFEALVTAVASLQNLGNSEATTFLRFLLRRFIQLRESVKIALKKIAKPNLRQLNALIAGLLGVKSGGRFPAFLATAMFQTLSECHSR
jgi:SacI restriction endonuclease